MQGSQHEILEGVVKQTLIPGWELLNIAKRCALLNERFLQKMIIGNQEDIENLNPSEVQG